MTPRPDIEAVVFDLGGVVLDVRMAAGLAVWAERAGFDARQAMARLRADRRYEHLERGQIAPADYHRHVLGLLGGTLSYDDFLAGWNAVFFGYLPGAAELLDRLAGRVRLGCLSNTNAAHAEFFLGAYPDLAGRFETMVLSHRIGARKPEPASYRAVVDAMDLAPQRVAFVDDRPENIAAAEAMGFVGILAAGSAGIEAHLRRLGVLS